MTVNQQNPKKRVYFAAFHPFLTDTSLDHQQSLIPYFSFWKRIFLRLEIETKKQKEEKKFQVLKNR